MQRKIFINGEDPLARAYIGWQDDKSSLYGLKEGYKKAADDLVTIALSKGTENRIDILDTYIYPIMYCYRHSIEISLKLIYKIVYGDNASTTHNILDIWDKDIVEKVLEDIPINIKESELNEIRELINQLQGKGEDFRGDVWRYLMDKKGELYFAEWQFIDYNNLKETMGYLYDDLDAMLYMIDDALYI